MVKAVIKFDYILNDMINYYTRDMYNEGLYGKTIACNIENKEDSIAVCYNCGEHIAIDLAYMTEDGYVCEECYDNHYVECNSCGNIIHEDDSYTTADGEIVCESCRDEHYTECSSCGELYHNDDIIIDDRGDAYCNDCYSEIYTTCEVCGAEMERDDAYWCERQEMEMCDYCYENKCKNNSIHDYGYKPYPIFHKDKNDNSKPVYFGLELEVYSQKAGDMVNDMLEELSDNENEFYFKEDGSLNSETGVELVSHPRSLRDYYSSQILEKIYEKFNEYDCEMPSGYSNHIHISRYALDKEQWINFIDFFHIVKDKILAISKREEHTFNRWCGFYYKQDEYKDLCNINRYYCVNVSPNETIEVRIFEGHNTVEEVYANLQFVDTLLNLSKEYNFKELTTKNVWGIFRSRAKMYKELDNKLKSISL